MATYQIWADITQLAPDRFFISVSAVPKDERTEHRTGGVKTAEARSLEEAQALRDQMVLDAGKRLRSRGHVIRDVIEEAKSDPPSE
ncbi:MAG TPA: hypothetical protein VHP55_03560 [Usitatibacter sp.]|jgi:hypothetical protein|nr:hypothetical protein [Usitatibacter sp.]